MPIQLSPRQTRLTVAALTAVALAALIVYVQMAAQAARSRVPELEPIVVFPDFASVPDTDVRKQQFFDYLQDYIVAELKAILELRDEASAYADLINMGVGLSSGERQRFLELAERYRIDTSESGDRGIAAALLRRVDIVPLSLALAQAANESAWGTSRFTLEGNNLFGQWCYDQGCGLVPLRRRPGDSHEVEYFDSVTEAVRAYIHNINTHPSYRNLREIREWMRENGQELDPMRLAAGLTRYSERGDNYIDEVQTLIRQNNLRIRDEVQYATEQTD